MHDMGRRILAVIDKRVIFGENEYPTLTWHVYFYIQ